MILTWVTVGEPLQSIDKTLTIIDTLPELLLDSFILAFKLFDELRLQANAELTNFFNNSSVRPCFANGAGSTPLLVKRSAKQAKHFNAVSATYIKKKKKSNLGHLKVVSAKFLPYYFSVLYQSPPKNMKNGFYLKLKS